MNNIDYADCKDSNMMKHAKRELVAIGALEDWPIYRDILAVFSSQGHSGGSASVVIPTLSKLLSQEPLGPLTGKDDEWTDVSEYSNSDTLYQNKRCSHVFKDSTHAWDINGKVFVEPDGATFTSKDSSVTVTFPYTPKTEFVDVSFVGED